MIKLKLLISLSSLFATSLLTAEPISPCGNNEQAEALIQQIRLHKHQQRTTLECNIKLNEIALIKANLILQSKDIWHDAGHMTPNQLLRHHGFKLPRTYPYFGNQVEALAGGEETVEEVFTDFLESEPHKKLLLGEDEFFKSQDQIGAAFIKDLSSEHEYYWVVIIADEKNHTIKQDPVIAVNPPVVAKKKHRGREIKERLYRNKVRHTWRQ
ncbi:MAG: hypothetical protein R3E90_15840 [Marinicella sp.]|nr:hypothetical protein [Xanthomonadales bacterium]